MQSLFYKLNETSEFPHEIWLGDQVLACVSTSPERAWQYAALKLLHFVQGKSFGVFHIQYHTVKQNGDLELHTLIKSVEKIK